MKGVLPVYGNSFFCSQSRQDGLQLEMMYEDGVVWCEMNISNLYEGYTDVVHGGMLFGILDTSIWYAIFMATKKICMTRKTEIEFYRPVVCDRLYIAKARFLTVEERDFFAEAWIEDGAGEVCARVNALFRESKDLTIKSAIHHLNFSKASPEIKDFFYSLLSEGK